jgi:branched-chain amino acid transport system ATP-binding protein
MSRLAVEALSVARGAKPVLHEVSLTLESGRILALLGPNGAGKSTLVAALAGLLPATAGRVTLDGTPVTGLAPDRIRRAGIAAVPEGHQVLTRLSVRDNVRVASRAPGAFAAACATFPELAPLAERATDSLSGGEQQMLALGRGLMSLPRLLMVDEPFLGLAPQVMEQMKTVFESLKSEGMAILFIEQNVRLALSMSSRGYILESGRLAAQGPSTQLVDSADVRRIFLGE